MLVFRNGTISYVNATEVLRDVTAGTYDGTCGCTISTLTENKKGRYGNEGKYQESQYSVDEGKYQECQYSVLVNYSEVDLDTFNPSIVKLVHNRKGELGNFTVQRIEYYDITRTIEIWV